MIIQYIITQLKSYFLILLFLVVFKLSAQSPYYYNLGEENGLPSSEVYQIIQDDFGYIWIGCDAGLFRFDGIRFKYFNSKKQNSKSISGLKIDKDKNLWCQNFSGQIFKVTQDSLALVIDASDKISSYSQYTIDNEKHIWIANIKTIEAYDFKGNKLLSFSKLIQVKDTINWHEIELNTEGKIYVSSQKYGVGLITKMGSKYDVTFLNSITSQQQNTALEPYANSLLALTEVNIKREYIISLVTDRSIVQKNRLLPFTKDGLIYKVYKDNLNRHWLCTSSGIVKLNKDFKIDAESKFFFKSDKISGIYQDREGNLWVSSLQNGIYIIPNYDLSIYHEENSNLVDHNITALLKTIKNELLIGTYTGSIYKLTQNNTFELFPQKRDLAYRTVKKMKEWDNVLDVAHGPFSIFENKKETVFNAYNLRDFCWLGDSLFFVTSSMFGVYPNFHTIPNNELGKRAIILHNRGCRAIALNEKTKTVYFASIDGLFKYENGKISEVKVNGNPIFANKLIFKNDKLWVGSVNDGLFILQNDEIWKHYVNGNLLFGNSVKSFKIVDETIFVATEEGLTQINYKINRADFFNYSDGIVSKEINDIEYWNNFLFLATNKGLLKLTSKISKNTVYPNIKITSFKVNLLEINVNEKQLNLEYNKNIIDIEFNSACLKARGNFKYKYRLIGLDSNWTIVPAINNKVLFASLPAGNFTFEVKAINEDGVESLKCESFSFTIKKPFWQKVWFYILIAASGAFLVFLISVIVIKNIRKKERIKNELTSSQLTAIRAQMNPHFMYNTLNSIQDLILKSDIKSTNYYLSKFSSLMRKILEFSENERIVLADEIEMLNDYLELEKLRFGDDFKYEINCSKEIKTDKLFIPSLIIQPFVENAIKHGLLHKKGEKKLSLTFSVLKDLLTIIIEDNGVGRKRSAEIKSRNTLQHKSFATNAVQKRVELLNGNRFNVINYQIIDLYNNNNEALGIKVEIVVTI